MEKRYLGPVILSVLLLVYSFSFLLLFDMNNEIIPIIPGVGYSDYILIIVIPIAVMLLMGVMGHFLALGLVPIHKGLKLNRYNYFIIQQEKKMRGTKLITRSIYPGLLAINIAMYIALYGLFENVFYVAGSGQELPVTIEWTAIIIGIPIATLVITPIWILESSGLMCSINREKYKNPISPDIESVGRFYSTIFKGYVGISTVVTYIIVLFAFASRGVTMSNYFIIFIDPLALILFFVFLSLILEVRINKINEKLFKRYEKMGINLTPQEVKITPKE